MNGQGMGTIAGGVGALLFGIVYALVVYVPLHKKHGGYTSLLVVGGVMGTLAFLGLMYEDGFLWAERVGKVFILTGAPMIAGEAVRTKVEELKKRADLERRLEEVTHDHPATVAER